MNAQRLRAISDYNKVASTKADTKDPHELVKLLFEGLTDRIARARSALAKDDREGKAHSARPHERVPREGDAYGARRFAGHCRVRTHAEGRGMPLFSA